MKRHWTLTALLACAAYAVASMLLYAWAPEPVRMEYAGFAALWVICR